MKVSTDVLAVLERCTFGDTCVFLPTDNGPLDRKLYVATDKVLKACGGKWNRGAKAHVFDSSARDRVELVLTTGEVQTSSDIGFFPTPDPLAVQLVEMAGVKRGHRVLEPSAGTGNIVLAIQDAGGIVTAVERDGGHRVHLAQFVLKGHDVLVPECADFMLFSLRGTGTPSRPSFKFDAVVMNPPFCKVGLGDHLDHVRHAHSMLKPGGVLVSVLPTGVTFREDRRHREFREWVLERGTIEKLPEDSFRESGTSVRTCVARMVA